MTHVDKLLYFASGWIDNDSKHTGAERTFFAEPNDLFGWAWLRNSMERHHANVPIRWYRVSTTRHLGARDCDGVSIAGAHCTGAVQHER